MIGDKIRDDVVTPPRTSPSEYIDDRRTSSPSTRTRSRSGETTLSPGGTPAVAAWLKAVGIVGRLKCFPARRQAGTGRSVVVMAGGSWLPGEEKPSLTHTR